MTGPKPATRIRVIRKQQGLTLKQIAYAIGTTPQTAQRLETGNMTVSMEWLEKIARALDVPIADLLVERTQISPEDVAIEMTRAELMRARTNPRERSVLAFMEATGQYAAMLIEGQAGVRPWQDVTKAAATAAACAIRIALDGEPGRVAVAPPVLVSSREVG
jgi:transcriptional regulator with XRE-family HTH domain